MKIVERNDLYLEGKLRGLEICVVKVEKISREYDFKMWMFDEGRKEKRREDLFSGYIDICDR